MHTWFWLSFFCGFPDVYWSDNVFCTWGWILTLTCLKKMFFQILSSCVVNHFSRGLMRYVEGFQCIDGPFRVYMSPLTLFHLFVSCWSQMVNKCSWIIWRKRSPAHFSFPIERKQTENPDFVIFCLCCIDFFYFTENRKFTNALYIKYLYVFVKQAYNTSGFP